MSYARRHLTWPCGMHEEVELEGLGLEYKDEPDKVLPCRLHGLSCHKGAGKPHLNLR